MGSHACYIQALFDLVHCKAEGRSVTENELDNLVSLESKPIITQQKASSEGPAETENGKIRFPNITSEYTEQFLKILFFFRFYCHKRHASLKNHVISSYISYLINGDNIPKLV